MYSKHFRWLTDELSRQLSDAQRQEVPRDRRCVLNLLQYSHSLGIDPLQAAREGGDQRREEPADKARGSSRKCTKSLNDFH